MAFSLTAASGISAATSIASSLASSSANIANIKSQGETDIANIRYAKNDYIRRSEISFQQEEAIDREMGSMLSQRGLEAMKAESRLRAGAASTGASGASMNEYVSNAMFDNILDDQVIIAKERSAKLNTERTRLADYMNFKALSNKQTQYNSSGSPLLASIGTGLNTLLNISKLSGTSINDMGLSNAFSNNNVLSGYKSLTERNNGN